MDKLVPDEDHLPKQINHSPILLAHPLDVDGGHLVPLGEGLSRFGQEDAEFFAQKPHTVCFPFDR